MNLPERVNGDRGQWWETETGERVWRYHANPERSQKMREHYNQRYNSPDYVQSLWFSVEETHKWLCQWENNLQELATSIKGNFNFQGQVELTEQQALRLAQVMISDRQERQTKNKQELTDYEAGMTVLWDDTGFHSFDKDGHEILEKFHPREDRSKWKKAEGPLPS